MYTRNICKAMITSTAIYKRIQIYELNMKIKIVTRNRLFMIEMRINNLNIFGTQGTFSHNRDKFIRIIYIDYIIEI